MSDIQDLAEAPPATETIVQFRETLGVMYDRLLVRRTEPVLMTKGGLHVAESHAERPSEGYVILTGEGRLMRDGSIRPLVIKVKDRVLFGKFSGSATEVDTPSGPMIVLREDEVLAYWRAEELPVASEAVAPTEG